MYNYPYGDNQQINLNWIISEIIALHQRLDPDYTAPTFTQIYPFSDTQQLNLDWILTELKALKDLAPTPPPTEEINEIGQALIAGAYDATTSYQKNDYIVQDGKLYRANAATTGTFDPTKWREILLGDDLAIITRWADTTNTYLNNLAASNVANNSSVTGATVKDALDTLKNAVPAMTTNNVSNESDVTGTTATAALNNLNGALTSLQNATNGKKYKIVCGAIRNSGSGWEIINNSGHNPINITGVSVQTVNDVTVLQLAHNVGATKVLSMLVGCDETFAELYDIGASVGLNVTNLTVYRKAHVFGGMIIVNNQTPDLQYSDYTLRTFYPDGGIDVNYPETITVQEVFRISTSGMNCICEPYSLGVDHCILRARNVATGEYYTKANIPNNTRLIATFNVAEKIVDPSTIVNANGNFWILGLLEVE